MRTRATRKLPCWSRWHTYPEDAGPSARKPAGFHFQEWRSRSKSSALRVSWVKPNLFHLILFRLPGARYVFARLSRAQWDKLQTESKRHPTGPSWKFFLRAARLLIRQPGQVEGRRMPPHARRKVPAAQTRR